MNIISPANSIIFSILGPQVKKRDDHYRLSFSCVSLFLENKTLLFNNITKELIQIPASLASLQEEDFDYLISHWFYVPEEFNEMRLADELLSVIQLIPISPKHYTYTILSTTQCNANCFYCFENTIKKYPMKKETALMI